MGKIVALDGEALAWARDAFAAYYRREPVDPPVRLARREFAAFPFSRETIMRRHAVLPTVDAFRGFLRDVVPRHVYYSSAYYTHPDHPSMEGKQWLGADLIFDLDADHLRHAEGLGYVAQLARVKEQLKRLYDDFLLGDFAVDPHATSIVFSGGRGYHIHVRDERFRGLSSPERRELVDYLQGGDTDPAEAIVEERHADGGDGRSKRFRRLSAPDAPGWKGRTTRGLFELLGRWDAGGASIAAADMVRAGMPAREAERLSTLLVTDGGGRKIRESRSLDVLPKNVPTDLFRIVLKSAAIEVQGETDAPVTTDIHRLIRLPGSLHGGTGFRVVPLGREALDAFDPFRDAVPRTESTEPVRVLLNESVEYPFSPLVRGAVGETIEVAPSAGLFLLLRGEGVLLPSPGS
ncbi:MAG: DNA primase small subunit PriS [Thermoplasmata archaeon]|nr:DNA primase small subunit PriS [Thermoplasmata archaeon]